MGDIVQIKAAQKSDHAILIEIWEASVRATHDFLPDAHIAALKPLILNQYFDAVDLKIACDDSGQILGFCGVHDGNIEMLFIAPEARGKGVGKQLALNAITHQAATKVDVNEQNDQALGFYKHMGFRVIGRSPLDGQGNPYPLLHMALN